MVKGHTTRRIVNYQGTEMRTSGSGQRGCNLVLLTGLTN